VLAAVARVTVGRLERHHLFALVKPAKPVNTPRARPALRMMLDVLGSLPAVLLGPRLEVVAINRMGKILLDDVDRVPADRGRPPPGPRSRCSPRITSFAAVSDRWHAARQRPSGFQDRM